MTMAEYLKSQRTLSPQEVERRAQQHDVQDFTAQERSAQYGGRS